MQVEISKQEAWRILDAIQAYVKNYSVTGAVEKTLGNVTKKLKVIIND